MLKAWLVLAAVSKTKTCWGVSAVSEMITLPPSDETANTFPGADENGVSVFADGSSTISPAVPNNPESVPRYAFVP